MNKPITILLFFLINTAHSYVFGQGEQFAFNISIPTAGNSWIMTDNTARKGYRMDYSGGNESTGFYLKNCGFSDENTRIGTELKREEIKKAPQINFSSLDE